MIGQIELTEAEQELANKIVFDQEKYVRLEAEQAIKNGELTATLMRSLMACKAIPGPRLRYFADADYNTGISRIEFSGLQIPGCLLSVGT
jgi:hypothetical protein